jgi:replicative DNA helicase
MTQPPRVPMDRLSEQCLLSCLILDPATIPALLARSRGAPGFYDDGHREVFEVIRHLHASGVDPDAAAIFTELKGRGLDATVGGCDGFARIVASVSSGANWEHYLDNVEEAARRRDLLNTWETVAFKIRRGAPLQECLLAASDGVARASRPTGPPRDVTVADAAAEVMADLEAGKPRVVKTGLAAFDNEFGGVPFPGLTTFLGVPGSGKSSLAAGIARRVAEAGHPVRVFSYEMSPASVAANLLAMGAEAPVHDWMRSGTRPGPNELLRVGEAADTLSDLNIAFVEDLLSASQIEVRCALAVAAGVRCVVVDYIQNLPPDCPGDSDTVRIEAACRALQRVSRQHGIAVLMVSQMVASAAREDRPPRKHDGMGSAAIEQVSDCMIGVYRSVVFNPRSADESLESWSRRKAQAELHVLKNKKGPCGYVEVEFVGAWTKFRDPQ